MIARRYIRLINLIGSQKGGIYEYMTNAITSLSGITESLKYFTAICSGFNYKNLVLISY